MSGEDPELWRSNGLSLRECANVQMKISFNGNFSCEDPNCKPYVLEPISIEWSAPKSEEVTDTLNVESHESGTESEDEMSIEESDEESTESSDESFDRPSYEESDEDDNEPSEESGAGSEESDPLSEDLPPSPRFQPRFSQYDR